MSLPEELLQKYDVATWTLKNEEEFLDTATYPGDVTKINLEDYSYIAKLLITPIKDGRHRIIWLILCPYAINILKLERDEAVELISKYIEECNELYPTSAGFTLEYHLNRAIITGLKPPKLDSLMKKDIDLYNTIIDSLSS